MKGGGGGGDLSRYASVTTEGLVQKLNFNKIIKLNGYSAFTCAFTCGISLIYNIIPTFIHLCGLHFYL